MGRAQPDVRGELWRVGGLRERAEPTKPPSAPTAMPASRAAVRQRMCSSRAIATHKPATSIVPPTCRPSPPRYSHPPRMAAPQAEYELVLMLDPEAPDERREQIASDARKRIESNGEIKHDTSWGMRKMAYEIHQRTEADYRFFRFGSNGTPLLDDLNHNLRIADGVLRFRLFKVDPRTPVIVPPPPTPLSSGRPERPRRDGDRRGGGYSRGADDEPVAAPIEPVETVTAKPAAEAARTAGRGPRRHRGAAGRSARCPRGAGRSARRRAPPRRARGARRGRPARGPGRARRAVAPRLTS